MGCYYNKQTIMKRIQLVFTLALISLAMLTSCNYNNKLVYTETQCADPWEHDSNQTVYKNNIHQYLAAHGVNTNLIEIEVPDTPNGIVYCAACTCPSGRSIEIWVTDAEVTQAQSLGFH
jgi:hypothetical protein